MLLISYMMKKYSMPYEECLKKIQQARPCCQPNMGFMKQLLEYEKELGIKK
jgi:hypothetical protein